MVKLSDAEKQDLETAVAQAEKHTSAEIVLAVAGMCDDYRAYTLPYAVGAGFAVFGLLAWLVPDMHVRIALLMVAGATVLVALILQWRPLRVMTTPRAVRDRMADRMAQAEYAALVAGRTSGETGLLVFIALAEHHAEIVPEPALAARVPQETWQLIMDNLTAELKAGRVVEGIKAAVIACGDAAGTVFPADASDRNEIANAPRSVRPQ